MTGGSQKLYGSNKKKRYAYDRGCYLEKHSSVCTSPDAGEYFSAALQYGRQYCGRQFCGKRSTCGGRYNGQHHKYLYRIFSGLATGSGIIISQYFGEKNEKGVHDAVHTTIALTFLMSLICTVCAILLVPAFLHMMGTPKDVFNQSAVYLRIYFAGSMGLLFYNMGAGILRAVGDSRRPLYFLVFSALLNIGLDLFFVAYLGLGVAGVAWATIISQGASAILIMAALSRETESYRVIWRKVRINPVMTRKIFQIGLPSALQMAVTSFSNVFVQSYINHFGSAAMAGWSSYGKIDKFCLLPIQSISMGVTTFVGQNLGARKLDRVKRSTRVGLMICFGIALVIIIPVWLAAGSLVRLFNQSPDVLSYGTLFVRLEMPFYFALCINQITRGRSEAWEIQRRPW